MQAQDLLLVANAEHVASENFGGETVLVHFQNGKYFNLSGSASIIWEQLLIPCSLESLTHTLSTYFNLSEEELSKHLHPFIEKLQEEKLLIPAVTPGIPTPLQGSALFSPPLLEGFSDLQELIYLDPVHDTDPVKGWPKRPDKE